MSSDVAIRVEGLGKRYRIGERQERYKTLRETLTEAAVAPFKRVGNLFRGGAAVAGQSETIWALKDVSFEVKKGEIVGVIGRNGAGKSTLLKVLSRITEPTEGRVEIHGRVGSLLEVGTGFHPELTGRENIFLNGAILGMRREEIRRKLDEIVAFAEIEKFVDTAVKHYSSGMYLRLAFSVAAHLETEVLLVDEVLAVGDARFQRRCLRKMESVSDAGCTVLFVSHQLESISALCSRGVLLDRGRVAKDGAAAWVVSSYLDDTIDRDPLEALRSGRRGLAAGDLVLQKAELLGPFGAVERRFQTGEAWKLSCTFQLSGGASDISLGFSIRTIAGRVIMASNMEQYSCSIRLQENEVGRASATVASLPLVPGRYSVSIFLASGGVDVEVVEDVLYFDVDWGNERAESAPRPEWGPVSLPVVWATAEVDPARND